MLNVFKHCVGSPRGSPRGQTMAGLYVNGLGQTYEEVIRKQSFPIVNDVPAHAQRRARPLTAGAATRRRPNGAYHTLHPMEYMLAQQEDAASFAKVYGNFGIRTDGDPDAPVHERLYTPSKTVGNRRFAASQPEKAGDQAFGHGKIDEAVRQYSIAARQMALDLPRLNLILEKRCAALAHLGRYGEALKDAARIESTEYDNPAARLRVKCIHDFNARRGVEKGSDHMAATLMVQLTPPSLKMWRAATPSAYKRAYPFGRTLASKEWGLGAFTGPIQ